MEEGKQTFKELLVGIIVFGVLLACLGFFAVDRSAYFIGLFLGILVALVFVCDMYHSIRNCIFMEQKQAVSYTKKKSLFRLIIAIGALVVAALLVKVSIIGTLFGALTLKFSAYLQPLTHKYLIKISKGR